MPCAVPWVRLLTWGSLNWMGAKGEAKQGKLRDGMMGQSEK